jgi:hypothetical protein
VYYRKDIFWVHSFFAAWHRNTAWVSFFFLFSSLSFLGMFSLSLLLATSYHLLVDGSLILKFGPPYVTVLLQFLFFFLHGDGCRPGFILCLFLSIAMIVCTLPRF